MMFSRVTMHCTVAGSARVVVSPVTCLHQRLAILQRARLQRSVLLHGALLHKRSLSTSTSAQRLRQQMGSQRVAMYLAAVALLTLGATYASVPLYQLFCQATGYGGTTQTATEEKFKTVRPVAGAKPITVYFNAETSSTMPWTFIPQQRTIKVVPGETALAFYSAHNPTDHAVTGVSTYNVTPQRAGVYFNKIQCFCFEEQRLRAHEEVDMPVFFYIDPAILKDPYLAKLDAMTLNYTFFRTSDPEIIDVETELHQRAGAHVGSDADGSDSAQRKAQAWKDALAARTGMPATAGASGAATQ